MFDSKSLLIELYNKNGVISAIAKIDKNCFKKVYNFRWYKDNKGYVVAHIPKSNHHVFLHQLILGKKYIDHINRNKLDNRKCNLRQVTHSQNKMNRPAPKNNKSGIKGVCFDKRRNKYVATLLIRGRLHLQKRFKTKKEATKQRIVWENKFFGKYNLC